MIDSIEWWLGHWVVWLWGWWVVGSLSHPNKKTNVPSTNQSAQSNQPTNPTNLAKQPRTTTNKPILPTNLNQENDWKFITVFLKMKPWGTPNGSQRHPKVVLKSRKNRSGAQNDPKLVPGGSIANVGHSLASLGSDFWVPQGTSQSSKNQENNWNFITVFLKMKPWGTPNGAQRHPKGEPKSRNNRSGAQNDPKLVPGGSTANVDHPLGWFLGPPGDLRIVQKMDFWQKWGSQSSDFLDFC